MDNQLDFIVENPLLLKFYDKKDLEKHRKKIHDGIVRLLLASHENHKSAASSMGATLGGKHAPLRHEDL